MGLPKIKRPQAPGALPVGTIEDILSISIFLRFHREHEPGAPGELPARTSDMQAARDRDDCVGGWSCRRLTGRYPYGSIRARSSGCPRQDPASCGMALSIDLVRFDSSWSRRPRPPRWRARAFRLTSGPFPPTALRQWSTQRGGLAHMGLEGLNARRSLCTRLFPL